MQRLVARSLVSRLGGVRAASAVAGKPTAEIFEEHYPDPGPPATFDDVPIPFKSYTEEYNRQQGKFNAVLGASTVVFVASIAYALMNNIYSWHAGQAPIAYKKRLPRPDDLPKLY